MRLKDRLRRGKSKSSSWSGRQRRYSRNTRLEQLEERQMLSAENLFAQFVGIVEQSSDVEQIPIAIAPERLGVTDDEVYLGFQTHAREGNSFDPDAVRIIAGDGAAVTPAFSRDDLAGSVDSVVVAGLSAGNYTLEVFGDVPERSQYLVDVYLVGDVDGDHLVDRDDLSAIRGIYGSQAGDDRYQLAADANLDGRISAMDLSLARRNMAASEPADNLLAQFDGVLRRPTDTGQISINVGLDGGSTDEQVYFALQTRGLGGGDLDPNALQIRDADGNVVSPQYTVADLPGGSDSVVVAALAAGDYTLGVSGDASTRSHYQVDMFLAGDVNGDHVVDRDDLSAIRGIYGSQAGDDRYQLAADANLDGRISAIDLSLARRNYIASPPIISGGESVSVDSNSTSSCASLGLVTDSGWGTVYDRVTAVTPAAGYKSDAAMKFYESQIGWVQPLSSPTAPQGGVIYVPEDPDLYVEWRARESDYGNKLVVFRVDDVNGTIDGVSPNTTTYLDKVAGRVLEGVFESPNCESRVNPNHNDPENGGTLPTPSERTYTIDANTYHSFYVEQGAYETTTSPPNYKWFVFQAANVDNFPHFTLITSGDYYQSGATTYGVEDLASSLPNPADFTLSLDPYGTGGGDFDDVIFTYDIKPQLDDIEATLEYTEGDDAAIITYDLTVVDQDSFTIPSGTPGIVSATIKITNNYIEGEDELDFVDNDAGDDIEFDSWNSTTGTLTLTGEGTPEEYQDALRAVTYENTSQDPCTDTRTVSFTVNDGYLDSNTATIDISVDAYNTAPVNSVPGTQTLDEDAELIFSTANSNAISIDDVDAGNNEVEVTLTATSGSLSLAQTTGLTFSSGSGTHDCSMTFTGTITNINQALDGMVFLLWLNYTGSAGVEITTDDQGNSGYGPDLTDTDTVNITIDAINDGPVNAVPGSQTTDEDTDLVFSIVNRNAISIMDADAGSSSVEVSLAATHGTTTLSQTTGLTFSSGDGTSDANMTFTGELADINAALDNLIFTPTLNYVGSASLEITTDDLGHTGSGGNLTDNDTINITVNPVNDSPTLAGIEAGALAYTENDGPLAITASLTVDDVDDMNIESASVQITGNFVTGEDVLAFTDTGSINGSWNGTTGTLTLTGSDTLANYQTALRAVTYENTSDNPSSATRTVSFKVNDGDSDSSPVTRNIAITAVNDAPVNSVPTAQATYEDIGLEFSYFADNAISISDIDANGAELEVTLTATHGFVTLGGTVGLNFSVGDGTDDASMTFTGTAARINVALNGLIFTPDQDYSGTEAKLTVTTNDQGNTGGAAQSDEDDILITVNDAPTPTLTVISGSGVDGDVYTEGSVYKLNLATSYAVSTDWYIDWDGDDSYDLWPVSGVSIQATHVYTDDPAVNPTIKVKAYNEDGWINDTNPVEVPVEIYNVAPELRLDGSDYVDHGEDYSLDLSSYDPGDDTITQWEIDWGDSSAPTVLVAGTDFTSGENPPTQTHNYTPGKPTTYSILVTAQDEDGTWHADPIDVYVNVQPEDGVLWLMATVRDFGDTHTDFELNTHNMTSPWAIPSNGWYDPPGDPDVAETGIVESTLGVDGKPVPDTSYFADPDANTSISTTANFNQWFRDNQTWDYGGQTYSNITTTIQLPFTLVTDTEDDDYGLYRFYSDSFFPIDDIESEGDLFEGCSNNPSNHNFHFTVEVHTAFTYTDPAGRDPWIFDFEGDDDLWVFIDGSLVVDVGGVHSWLSDSVNVDSLGLTVGETYSFDMFYAERNMTGSHLKATTSIALEPAIPLVEEDRFRTALDQQFELPPGQEAMVVSYSELFFDEDDPRGPGGFINDAFELALVDEEGNPVVQTVGLDRNTFFNYTQTQTPLLADGVWHDGTEGTVTVDISHLPAGMTVHLLAHLIGNDQDELTSVLVMNGVDFLADLPTDPTNAPPQTPMPHWHEIDFDLLSDVTALCNVDYQGTSFNAQSDLLFVDLDLTTTADNLRGPLLVGVRNFTAGGVQLYGAHGLTPEEVPYYEVTDLATVVDGFITGASGIPLVFKNREIGDLTDDQIEYSRFEYELVVLGQLNQPPTITNEPEEETVVGKTFEFVPETMDPNNDAVTVSLLSGPTGMTCSDGVVTWDTSSADASQYWFKLRATDTLGAYSDHAFVVNLITKDNTPPRWDSDPVVDAWVGTTYVYESLAIDDDGDTLEYGLYSLDTAITTDPAYSAGDFTVDPNTGVVTWENVLSSLIGEIVSVEISVTDNYPGHVPTIQPYEILVHADPLNHPPEIVSKPITCHDVSGDATEPTENVTPADGTHLVLGPGETYATTIEVTPDTAVDQGNPNFTPLEAPAGQMTVITLVEDPGDPNYGLPLSTDIIRDHLLGAGGTGIVVTNADLQEHISETHVSAGVFINNNATYGLSDYGIVLSSGDAAEYGSGDNSTDNEFSFNSPATTDDEFLLDQISGGNWYHYDATRYDITFDMLPGYDTVYFNVVFGSEEYDYYVGSPYNDAFGLFVNGVNVAQCYAFGPPSGHPTRQKELVDSSVGEGEYIGPWPININHPQMTVLQPTQTELNAVLVPYIAGTGPQDNPVMTFAAYVGENTTGNTLTFIVADTSDAWLDTTVYISSLGGTPPLLDVDVEASSADGQSVFSNFTGIVEDVVPGQTASFNVEFTGDGAAHRFDLRFVDQETNTLLGTMPVTINDGYFYPVEAIDVDDDDLTYSLPLKPDTPDNIAEIDPITGRITWQPPSTPGNYPFTVRVEDGRGGFDEQSFVVVLGDGGTNTNPEITSSAPRSATVNREYIYRPTANDDDGEMVSFYLIGETPAGMTFDEGEGAIRWTPAPEQANHDYDITFAAIDPRGGKHEQSFTITVIPQEYFSNTSPSIEPIDPQEVIIGESFIYTVTAFDPDGDDVFFDFAEAPENMAIDFESGKIAWSPTEEQEGVHEIIISARDTYDAVDFQILYIDVILINDPPEIEPTPYEMAMPGVEWTYQIVATDPNGDELEYTIDPAYAWTGLAFSEVTPGLLTWTPPAVGDYPIVIWVDDNRGGFDDQGFVLQVRDDVPPRIKSEPTGPAIVGEEWEYKVIVEDDNVGDTYTLTIDQASRDRGMQDPDATDTIRWTPTATGTCTVRVTATDSTGLWSDQEFDLKVVPTCFASDPPLITSKPTAVTWNEGTGAFDDYEYILTGEDPDGDDALLVFSTGDDNTVGIVEWDGGLSKYVFRWNSPTEGKHQVVIRLTDEDGSWTEQWLPFDLKAPSTNQLPEFNLGTISGGVVDEEWTLELAPPVVSDPDEDDVELRLDEDTLALGVTLDENDTLRWTPDTDGNYLIVVIADDNQGTGVTRLEITLPVVPAGQTPSDGTPNLIENQPPDFDSVPPGWVRVGDTYEYQVVADDPDGNNAALFYSFDKAPAGMGIDQTGLLQWVPDEVGFYDVELRVTDEAGAYAVCGYTIEVTAEIGTNVKPKIKSKPTGPAVADVPYRYQVTAEDDNGDAFEYSFDATLMDQVMESEITAGRLYIDATSGLLTWDSPSEGGTYRIAVKATETETLDLLSSDTQYYDLKVLDNAPPHSIIIEAGSLLAEEGVPFSVQFSAIDPNCDDLTFNLGGGHAGMYPSTTAMAGDTMNWDSPIIGDYPFQICVTDDEGLSTSKWFTLKVHTAANTKPVIAENADQEIQVGLMFWHQVQVANPDNDDLTFSLTESPANAVLPMNIDEKTGVVWWQTSEADIGTSPHSYKVRVDDGRGEYDEKTFYVSVVHEASNQKPTISGDAVEHGSVGNMYLYEPTATDPEQHPLFWSIEKGPGEMKIDRKTGRITWQPTIDDVDTHEIVIRVSDAYGAYDEQPYTITVVGVNRAPRIDSPVPTRATVGEEFQYTLLGYDPDGDDFSFSMDVTVLTGGPATGFGVSPEGVMSWETPVEGTYSLILTVTDIHGKSSHIGSYTFTVGTENEPPKIQSNPLAYAFVGEQYEYVIDGYDSETESSALTYNYSDAADPFDGTMELVDDGTGVYRKLQIQPTVNDIGDHKITVIVYDDGTPSLGWSQEYTLTVLERTASLAVDAIDDQTVVQGQPLRIPVTATGDDVLYFSLANAPGDMELIQTSETTAVIQWWTDSSSTSHTGIGVTVTDRAGNVSSSETFNVTVQVDTEDPYVVIDEAPLTANIGQSVSIHVFAYDNVRVTGKTLTASINGGPATPLTLSSDGWAHMTVNEIGEVELIATAVDEAGHTSPQATHTFRVIDPSDLLPPKVTIHSPAFGEKITSPVDVLGSIDDPNSDNIFEWQLLVAESGKGFQPIASGSGELSNAAVGVLDPTSLPNGQYTVRLEATDINGNTGYDDVTVEIETDLKLGNFNLSFVDLQVSIGSIPITITRTYDTLEAGTPGNLGYGWSIDIASTSLDVYDPANNSRGMTQGTVLTFTLPDGSTESFKFNPQSESWYTSSYVAFFEPCQGTTSTLQWPDASLYPAESGLFTYTYDGAKYYNPGGNDTYALTTSDGIEYVIFAEDGELYSIKDRTGTTLYYMGDGIFTDPYDKDKGVSFEYSYPNHISALIDPAGQRIEYGYDPLTGDLVSMTNRENETVEYVYDVALTGRPHFLTDIIDDRGVTVLHTNFDPATGRLESLTDAAGNAASFGYTMNLGDGRHLEIVTDAYDVPTEVVHDDLGNVTRRIQRLSDNGTPEDKSDDVYQVTVYSYECEYDPELQTHASVPFEVTGDSLKYDYLPDPINWQSVSAYDSSGNVRSTTDALGNTTYYTYNGLGQNTTIADPLGNITENVYDCYSYYDWDSDTYKWEGTGRLTQTTDAEGNVTKFDYDSYGNLEQVIQIDDAGNPVIISDNDYDAQGRLTSVTDAANLTRHFVYDVLGNQTVSYYHWDNGVDDYRTIITRTDYDSEGRVVGSSQHEITGGSAAAGHKTITKTGDDVDDFYVQGTGWTTITADWTTTTQYNAAGQVEKTVDRLGNETWNFYDARGLLIEALTHTENSDLSQEKWLITRTVYDANGRVVYATDPYSITYTAITDAESYSPAAATAEYGTYTIYDDLGRVIETERVCDLWVEVYTANGQLATRIKDGTAGGIDVLSYSKTAYDDEGRVEHTISSDDTGAADGPRTDYYYDAAGRQIAVLGPIVSVDLNDNGIETSARLLTEYTYDAAGRQTQVATNISVTDLTDDRPAVTDPIFRNDTGKVNDSEAQTTYYEYDKVGRQTAVISTEITDPETTHVRTETVYDAMGRRVMVRENITQDNPFDADTIDDADVLETYYEYDNSGRLTAVVLPEVEHPDTAQDVRPRYEYTYDIYGNQTSIRDNVVHVSEGVGDYDHDGTTGDDTRVTEFTYDAYGRQIARTLPIGVAEASGFTETSQYDDLGRLELSTDFEDRVTKFVYDSFGRLEEKQYWSSTSSYTSNPSTPDQTVAYTYDAFGRVIDTDDSDAASPTTNTYDDEGRLLSVASPEGTVRYEYDENTGWLLRTYTGDADDAHTSANSDGKAITDTRYAYDDLGRLTTVTVVERNDTILDPDEVTSYRYDLAGNLDKVRLHNEVVTDYTYDELNRLIQLSVFDDDYGSGTDWLYDDGYENTLAEYAYELALDGKRTSVVEKIDHDSNPATQLQETTIDWLYDNLGRLNREVYDSDNDSLDFTADYLLDLVGNRLEKNVDTDSTPAVLDSYRSGTAMASEDVDEATEYDYDANDRLTREYNSSDNETTFYGYDVSGVAGDPHTVQTSKTTYAGDLESPSGTPIAETTYTYNYQCRMESVSIDSNYNGYSEKIFEYTYNDQGIRVSVTEKTDSGDDGSIDITTTTDYLVDANNPTGYAQVLEEKDGTTGAVEKSYTLGHDVISQADDSGTPVVHSFLYDGHGSTRALLNASGGIVSGEVYAYDAYGNPIGFNPANAATTILYSGEQTDATGLQYLRARYYDPATGAFNRLDPFAGDINDPQSLHKYLYAHANPANLIDPSGNFTVCGLSVSINIGSYLSATAISYGVSKAISATYLMIADGNLARFRWFEAWDLLCFVPGAFLAKIVKLPVQMVTRVGGQVVGKAFVAGGVQRVTASFSKWFAQTGGKLLMRSAGGGMIELEKGTAKKGFQHLLERHLVGFWKGSKSAVTTFWPSNVSPGDMLNLLKEAAGKYAVSGPAAQNIVLSNGITSTLVVHGGKVTTFYPVSGPGVVFARELIKAVP